MEKVDKGLPIAECNIGYRLLAKMGWNEKSGLGKDGTGDSEPLPLYHHVGILGLGKWEQDLKYTVNLKKPQLETILSINTTEEEKEKQGLSVKRDLELKAELENAQKAFFCQLCRKQYSTNIQFETHLSSYDHNHKKRLLDMKKNAPNTFNLKKKKKDKQLQHAMLLANNVENNTVSSTSIKHTKNNTNFQFSKKRRMGNGMKTKNMFD